MCNTTYKERAQEISRALKYWLEPSTLKLLEDLLEVHFHAIEMETKEALNKKWKDFIDKHLEL